MADETGSEMIKNGAGPLCACGRPFTPGDKYCGFCGRSLPAAPVAPEEKRSCPACGSALKPTARFCPRCGREAGGGRTTPPVKKPGRRVLLLAAVALAALAAGLFLILRGFGGANRQASGLAELRKGRLDGSGICIGDTMADISKQLGEPTGRGAVAGNAFAVYDRTVYFAASERADARVAFMALLTGAELYGARVGSTPAEIAAVLGQPAREEDLSGRTQSRMALVYEAGLHELIFISETKDKPAYIAFICRKGAEKTVTGLMESLDIKASDPFLSLKLGIIGDSKIGFGANFNDILNKLGQPDERGDFEGSEYLVYDGIVYFVELSYTEQAEQKLVAISFRRGKQICGATVGMTPRQIKAILGPPKDERYVSDDIEPDHNGWYLNYVAGPYELEFRSGGSNSPTTGATVRWR